MSAGVLIHQQISIFKLHLDYEKLFNFNMTDFESLRLVCEINRKISASVIDEFLISYAAQRNNLEYRMNQAFALYKHVNRKFPKEWVNMLKSQYLAHKIFREGGLLKNYMNHPALSSLDTDKRRFLELQLEHPWKFSFSTIKSNPAESFYIMDDVFSDQEYLLHSPGMKDTLKERGVSLWFNLISFNGECWQSFGPIGGFSSFESDDIFFFATELDFAIDSHEEFLANLEENPIPYMMLLSGAASPFIINGEERLVNCVAEYDLESMNTSELRNSFKEEYNREVYRLALKGWSGPPHFAEAYFDEKKKIILLSAMTESGFRALAAELNRCGYEFSVDPFLMVNLSMYATASDILKKKTSLNEYERFFSKELPKAEQEKYDKLNLFLKLLLPYINEGREPDIEELAKKADVDVELARELVKQFLKKF